MLNDNQTLSEGQKIQKLNLKINFIDDMQTVVREFPIFCTLCTLKALISLPFLHKITSEKLLL